MGLRLKCSRKGYLAGHGGRSCTGDLRLRERRSGGTRVCGWLVQGLESGECQQVSGSAARGRQTARQDKYAVGELDHGEGAGDVHEVDHVGCRGEESQKPWEAIEEEEQHVDGDYGVD